MRFQVEVPDAVFWKVAGRAETYDQKVNEFAADLLIAAAAAPSHPDGDPVVRLWRAGLSDAQIAGRLNRTNQFVSTRRRAYKLPANRRNGNG